jgi:hypothetical protein
MILTYNLKEKKVKLLKIKKVQLSNFKTQIKPSKKMRIL